MSETIIVPDSADKLRLDTYLAKKYVDISRAAWQKLIKQGDILLNKKKVAPHKSLKAGHIITISEIPDNNAYLKPTDKISFKVIDEDDDFLIIEKPAGLLSHPDSRLQSDTLVNQLIKYYPPIAAVGEDSLRPGLVHRLDQDVSGVMVIAKTTEAYHHLKKLFRLRQIKKEYLAVVYEEPSNNSGTINFSISRSRHHPHRMAARPDASGRQAETEYFVLKNENHRSLLRVLTKTGRTHQVRVHLFALGHPIVGDRLYHPKKKTRQLPDRLMLHAVKLAFTDLKNKSRVYHCPPPPPSSQWLNP
ncbi:MAG: RluA family pseudouridine synthase [Patescibacteria group bacterium]